MIDTKTLRRLALDGDFCAIHELLGRLEAAENDAAHQKALVESALRVAEGWERKCDALRAKVEAMEQQEPLCITTRAHLDAMESGAVRSIVGRDPAFATRGPNDIPLYALPGAKGE